MGRQQLVWVLLLDPVGDVLIGWVKRVVEVVVEMLAVPPDVFPCGNQTCGSSLGSNPPASPLSSPLGTLAPLLPQVQRHADGLRADRRRQDLLPQQHSGGCHRHDPPRRGRGVRPY